MRRIRIGASLGGLATLYIAITIGSSNALAFHDGAYGVDPGPMGPLDAEGMYVAVTGDAPFTLHLTITNTSRLAVEIRGLQEPDAFTSESGRVLIPRFVGLGVFRDPTGSPSEWVVQPFQPLVLEPMEQRDFAFLGMAGACALPDVGPEGQAGYSLEFVDLVYEQLTVEHVARVELPAPVIITTPGSCS